MHHEQRLLSEPWSRSMRPQVTRRNKVKQLTCSLSSTTTPARVVALSKDRIGENKNGSSMTRFFFLNELTQTKPHLSLPLNQGASDLGYRRYD
jgi:hypothetical protein